MDTDNPLGATSGYKIGIKNQAAIDAKLVAAGSVNSWLKGNFNYDLDKGFPQIGSGGAISPQDAGTIGKTGITQDTAGFFNLPVCQVKDLRSFPPASQGTGFKNSASLSHPPPPSLLLPPLLRPPISIPPLSFFNSNLPSQHSAAATQPWP